MRKRYTGICALAVASILVLAGCNDTKKVDYNVSDFEGNSVKEYDSTGEMTETESDAVTTEQSVARSIIAQKLEIPESAHEELAVDGTQLKKIVVDASDIKVPDTDRLYTKEYTLVGFDEEDKEKILRAILDKDTGVHNAPSDAAMTESYVDIILKRTDDELDLSADDFIGRIDGRIFEIHFISYDNAGGGGIQMWELYREIPQELQEQQVENISYEALEPMDDGVSELLSDEEKKNRESLDEVENKCGITVEEARQKALDYLDKWNLWDMKEISVADVCREGSDADHNVIVTDKYGYEMNYVSAINGQLVYQPGTAAIDTLRAKNEDGNGVDAYYNSEITTYYVGIDDKGITRFSCTYPMKSDDGLHEVTNLISWDEALESLQEAIPKHFEGYEGYSAVTFDDVRLTYFRTKTGEGTYEIIPVYVFAESSDWGSDETDAYAYGSGYPLQLIMLDARDGQEVNVVQNESRVGLTVDYEDNEGE